MKSRTPAAPMSPTFIDLFCGCGGFTLGMLRAGFRCVAAIDFNEEAIETLQHNLASRQDHAFSPVEHALRCDLTTYSPSDLEREIRASSIDVIVGGPPCQGFSTARQRDGSNHGTERFKDDDPRRHLYRRYLDFVAHFRPRVFVMENVLGIRSAAGGEYFRRVQSEARALGYRVHPQIENASELGIPQKRRRQLFIGTRDDQAAYFRGALERPPRAPGQSTVGEAIRDLPRVVAGGGEESREYDLKLRAKHEKRYGRTYLHGVLEVHRATKLTAHRARIHSDRDLSDFKKLKEGQSSAELLRAGVKFDFPYDKETFKDRYTRQHRDRLCSTIVAHLSKDGLMFIHPTQNRSLTPREAARIQSFPDWFEFPVARTHQFRLIGNAVPPLVGEAVGIAIQAYLERPVNQPRRIRPIPRNQAEALSWLMELVSASDSAALKTLSMATFKRGWFAISYLYPGLHPDGTEDHGTEICHEEQDASGWEGLSADWRLLAPYFVQTGWPVALAPIVEEAWSRAKQGELADDELYCYEAARAGMGIAPERAR